VKAILYTRCKTRQTDRGQTLDAKVEVWARDGGQLKKTQGCCCRFVHDKNWSIFCCHQKL